MFFKQLVDRMFSIDGLPVMREALARPGDLETWSPVSFPCLFISNWSEGLKDARPTLRNGGLVVPGAWMNCRTFVLAWRRGSFSRDLFHSII